jgi:hypothetical protein
MNLGDLGIVCGICVSLLTPAGVGLKYYADHEYVTIQSQNQKLLWDIEDEISYLQDKEAAGTITPRERRRLATLEERKRHLTQ